MINKSLIKRRFQKSYPTYDDNALIQKEMAQTLIKLVLQYSNKYESIFEIGSATGLLSKKIKNNLKYKYFYANDIVEKSKYYINNISPDIEFILGDIEEIKLADKYDLIISNASLQWCSNIEITIKKLIDSLKENGILAISIFGENNLKEIKTIFNINNTNINTKELLNNLKMYNIVKYMEREVKYTFNSSIDILKHLKLTGVNAIQEISLTKTRLKEFEIEYIKRYKQAIITYNPLYLIIRK